MSNVLRASDGFRLCLGTALLWASWQAASVAAQATKEPAAGKASTQRARPGRQSADRSREELTEKQRLRAAEAHRRLQLYRAIAVGDPEEIDLQLAMRREVALNFTETPLGEVLQFLRDFSNCNIVLDDPALARQKAALDRLITIESKGVSLRANLDRILRPLGLLAIVRERSIVVTDEEGAAARYLRVYPVGDLVVGQSDGNPIDASEDLIQTIQAVIEPDRWTNAGGEQRLRQHATTRSLLVHADYATQCQIEDLLVQLRLAKDAAAMHAADQGGAAISAAMADPRTSDARPALCATCALMAAARAMPPMHQDRPASKAATSAQSTSLPKSAARK